MSDHVKALENLARYWENHARLYPGSPEMLQERASAIRAVLEENKRLRVAPHGFFCDAEARIEAALALHVSFEKRGKQYCHHCDPDYDVGMVEYPCPSVTALGGKR